MNSYYNGLINVGDAFRLLSDQNVVFVDCRAYLDNVKRGRKEYIHSHIPGAVYMDLAFDLSAPVIKGITGRHPLPDIILLQSVFRNAGINATSQVIAYDQSNGSYASRCWWLLRWLGHDHVAVLNGGLQAWMRESGPTDNQWELPASGDFEANPRMEFIAGMPEIEQGVEFLVDSREHRRYTGEFEPIDPVAGHIPGAICLPFIENVQADGTWKSSEELKKRFGIINHEATPVFYCGSGVTACHNVLAYYIATGRDARLYPGSWSEWIHYHVADQK